MSMLDSCVFLLLQPWITKDAQQAFTEAEAMFPAWWEKGPKAAATAAAHRYYGETTEASEIDEDIQLIELAARSLAVEARMKSAIIARYTRLPNIAGIRKMLLVVIDKEDALETIRRGIIARYGINPDGLEVYFSKRSIRHHGEGK